MELKYLPGQFQISYMTLWATFYIRGVRRNSEQIILNCVVICLALFQYFWVFESSVVVTYQQP